MASGTAPSPAGRPAASPTSIPLAAPVTPGTGLDDAGLPSPVSIRLQAARRKSRNWKSAIVVIAFLAIAAGGAVYVATLWRTVTPEKQLKPTGDETRFAGLNFSYLIPARGWQVDDRVKDRIRNARLVLHQTNPPAWFAILAKDFRVRNPRPRELRAEAVHALEKYFPENLESEDAERSTILGRPVQRLRFRGQLHRQTYVGECHMFGHLGIGYWLISWSGSEGSGRMDGAFAELRRRFAFGDERKAWEEKQPAEREFASNKGGCRLRDSEALWEKAVQAARDFDPAADLVLHAREQDLAAEGDAKKNPRIGATVMVLVLPHQGNDLKSAVEAARAHLLDRQKMDYPETVLEPYSDKERPPDQAVKIGNARGHLSFLRVRNGETRHLLLVQAVIPGPSHTLVVQGECYWKQRETWQEAIVQIIKSLKVVDQPWEP